jgi:hypothetical protein
MTPAQWFWTEDTCALRGHVKIHNWSHNIYFTRCKFRYKAQDNFSYVILVHSSSVHGMRFNIDGSLVTREVSLLDREKHEVSLLDQGIREIPLGDQEIR